MIPAWKNYDLRHTTANLLLLAGENLKIVFERLGHASIVLTLDTYMPRLTNNAKRSHKQNEKNDARKVILSRCV